MTDRGYVEKLPTRASARSTCCKKIRYAHAARSRRRNGLNSGRVQF